MFLSRLILNPTDRRVHRDLGDCQQLHRTVMSAFPQADPGNEEARARYSVLYRVETDPRTGLVRLLVQSAEKPDWTRLPSGYLGTGPEGQEKPACKDISSALQGLRPGTRLRFRLRANPTRKIDTKTRPDGRKSNGRRVELRDDAARLEWLKRKADQGGFRLETVRINPDVPDALVAMRQRLVYSYPGRKRSAQGGRRGADTLTFVAVEYEGHLVVVDADLFRETLRHGVGPGKAYGFGLLSIAPAGR